MIDAERVALHILHCLLPAGYAIDVTLPALRIAIEADGPSHFSRTPLPALPAPHQAAGRPAQSGGTASEPQARATASSTPKGPWVLGATAMKRRHLRALGWSLISISWQVRPSSARCQHKWCG